MDKMQKVAAIMQNVFILGYRTEDSQDALRKLLRGYLLEYVYACAQTHKEGGAFSAKMADSGGKFRNENSGVSVQVLSLF